MTAEVEKFRKDLQVLKETAQQVQKDFESCGLDIDFSVPMFREEILPYEELLNRVKSQVEKSMKMQEGAFHNLLYRIDIPEKNFVQLKSTSNDFIHDVSRLILEREFMKVVTRRYYKP